MSDDLISAGYEAVYSALPNSATFQRIWSEQATSSDYPAEFGHISFVTLDEIRDLAASLRLGEGELLVDLACGAGGPGLWVASQTGSRLIGVDFAAAGVKSAGERADRVGLSDRASFVTGTFADTGLATGCASAAMSIDAIQYAPDIHAAMLEASRLLSSGGHFAFTAFELEPENAKQLPVTLAELVSDYRPVLEESGFEVEQYDETPGWKDRLTGAYGAVLAAGSELEPELGSSAFGSLAMEMALTLEVEPYRRRVFAVARKL